MIRPLAFNKSSGAAAAAPTKRGITVEHGVRQCLRLLEKRRKSHEEAAAPEKLQLRLLQPTVARQAKFCSKTMYCGKSMEGRWKVDGSRRSEEMLTDLVNVTSVSEEIWTG